MLGLAACNAGDGPASETTPSGPRPTETVTETVSPLPTGGALPAGWTLCVDQEQGYEIGYPETWHADAENLQDECRLFDPKRFDVEPQTELPVTAMMVNRTQLSFSRASEEWFDEERYEVRLKDETTVAGSDAFRYERVQREDLLYPEGTTYYGYLIDHEGDAFYVQTVEITGQDRNWQRFREVVDQAVETLTFTR